MLRIVLTNEILCDKVGGVFFWFHWCRRGCKMATLLTDYLSVWHKEFPLFSGFLCYIHSS